MNQFVEQQSMTAQQFYDKTKTHLLNQGERSTDQVSRRCLYRGPRGLKCAFGPFIPDDKYVGGMEDDSCYSSLVWDATGLPSGLKDLAVAIQRIHDNDLPADWPALLAKVAANFYLNP